MAFEIDHDWQGNLATPRARIGERVKNHLLIVLCAVWIVFGLVGHGPWKPNESASIGIVKTMLDGGSMVAPTAIGKSVLENPPLYYLSAAGSAWLLHSLLPMHDAARLASGLWMALTLLMIGMIGRELWGVGTGRQTTFIFMSSLGLVVTAHLLTPEVSNLTGAAMGFYGLALAKRRPYRAALLLGSGIGVSFLSTGLVGASAIVLSALLLPWFRLWRNSSYATVLGLSLLVALPYLLIWPVLCAWYAPHAWQDWWQLSVSNIGHMNHLYFVRTLAWYAWPALPIAAWGLWYYRYQLWIKPRFQLIIIFFLATWFCVGLAQASNEIYTLPLLIPFAAMAGGSVESLKRGAAGALNWFGLILFGLIGILIWLGWIAMMTGWPAKLAQRIQFLSGLDGHVFNWIELLAALVVSAIWLVSIKAKRSNRAAITEWAVGMTMAWSLMMTLWLPLIDSAKSYQGVMLSLKQALPADFACINTRNFGQPQQSLMYYYTDIKVRAIESYQRVECDLYLIRDERGEPLLEPGADWKLIWQGKRIADRRESFRLLQVVQH